MELLAYVFTNQIAKREWDERAAPNASCTTRLSPSNWVKVNLRTSTAGACTGEAPPGFGPAAAFRGLSSAAQRAVVRTTAARMLPGQFEYSVADFGFDFETLVFAAVVPAGIVDFADTVVAIVVLDLFDAEALLYVDDIAVVDTDFDHTAAVVAAPTDIGAAALQVSLSDLDTDGTSPLHSVGQRHI